MTQVIINNQAVSGSSVELTPTADFFVETTSEAAGVTIRVMAKIEATATYVEVENFPARGNPIRKYAALPFVRIDFEGNTVGKNVNVWVV